MPIPGRGRHRWWLCILVVRYRRRRCCSACWPGPVPVCCEAEARSKVAQQSFEGARQLRSPPRPSTGTLAMHAGVGPAWSLNRWSMEIELGVPRCCCRFSSRWAGLLRAWTSARSSRNRGCCRRRISPASISCSTIRPTRRLKPSSKWRGSIRRPSSCISRWAACSGGAGEVERAIRMHQNLAEPRGPRAGTEAAGLARTRTGLPEGRAARPRGGAVPQARWHRACRSRAGFPARESTSRKRTGTRPSALPRSWKHSAGVRSRRRLPISAAKWPRGELMQSRPAEARQHLQAALAHHRMCVRANMLAGRCRARSWQPRRCDRRMAAYRDPEPRLSVAGGRAPAGRLPR